MKILNLKVCFPMLLLLLLVATTFAAEKGAASPASVRLPVRFTSPGKGVASLAVYDAHGVLVRSLLSAQAVEAGPQTATWDATTDLGLPVTAGTYDVQGIFFTAPPALKYVMKVGKSGNPPFRAPDGKGDWGGNLGGPSAICANNQSLIMAWSCVEDNQVTGVQQMDDRGNIQLRYFTFYPWDCRCAGAMDETSFYLGIENWEKRRLEIAVYKLGEPRGKILMVLPTGAHEEQTESRWHGRWSAWLDGMALTKDNLYASIASDNALFVIDRKSGKIRNKVEVPAPRGLAVAGDRLLVVSNKKILKLRLDGSMDSVWIDGGRFKAPHALAVDATGNLYVGDSRMQGLGGENYEEGSRQVYVFSPEGKLLRTIGKAGGAPRSGRFEAERLGDIAALCIGPDGQSLWVQDMATGFTRTSRWSLNGKLERQWFSRKLSGWPDAINPSRPSELIEVRDAFSDEPGITAWEVDLTAKTWRPSWHYDCTWDDIYPKGVFLSHEHGGNPLKDKPWPVFHYNFGPLVAHGGHTYAMNSSGNDNGVIYILPPGEKPRPVAIVSYHRTEKDGGKLHGIYDQGPNNWFTWADRNGDGQISSDEIVLTENPKALEPTFRIFEGRLDEQLNVHVKRPLREGRSFRLVDSLLPVKRILGNGAPVYDWRELRDEVPLQAPDLRGGDGWKIVRDYMLPMPVETAEAFYSLVVPENDQKLKLPGIDGDTWWASRNWRTKLARFDKHTGRPLWAVGRRAPGRAEPGQMYYPASLAGIAGDFLFVLDTMGMVWVWHKDGLYVGRLYHDTATGQMDDQSIYCEIQGASIYHDPRTGKIYSLVVDTGTTIHEVSLPKVERLAGQPVTVTVPQAGQARAWDPDGVAPTQRPTSDVYFTAQPPKIDGGMDGSWWQLSDGRPRPEMLVLLDGQRLCSVRAMYDNSNLYLAYVIRDTVGPRNRGSELPYCPFVSGAYVDFCIAPDWTTPQREEVREGDLRVILARVLGGSGEQDFQQGFWQRKTGGENSQTITSPAASVHFDQIRQVPGLRMAYHVGQKDQQTGLLSYEVQVAVPLASLGLAEPAGRRIGFDLSIAVANAAGDRRERAGHWAGQSEGVVVDRPGSARLSPSTWGTLHFVPRR